VNAEELIARADAIDALADSEEWGAIERKALKFQSHRAERGRGRRPS